MSEYIVRETDCGLATKQEIVGELVRCKDCKYGEMEENGIYFCNSNGELWNYGDFFCSDGERKEQCTQ